MLNRSAVFAVLAWTGLLLTDIGTSSAAEPTRDHPLVLSFTSVYMPTHAIIKDGVEPWARELEEKSGGRLRVEIFHPNTLCPESETYDCVKNGIVDIGCQVVQRVSGKFPIAAMMDLPFLYSSAEMASTVNQTLVEESPELAREFAETQVLAVFSGAPAQIHLTKKEVRSWSDLKGLRIGSMTPTFVPILTALGGTSYALPTTDGYLALQRGQVDGVACPYAFMVNTKMYEVAKKSSTINMSSPSQYLVMNKDALASMPEDLRRIILDTAGVKLARFLGGVIDRGVESDLKVMRAQGQLTYEFPPEEIAKGKALTEEFPRKWMENCRAAGFEGGEALYRRAQELAAQFDAGTLN